MCHFLPVHHIGMAFLAGSKAKIQLINKNDCPFRGLKAKKDDMQPKDVLQYGNIKSYVKKNWIPRH